MLSVWLKVNWNGNILTCTRNECFQDKIVLYTLHFDVYQELLITMIWAAPPLRNNDQYNGVNTDNGAGFYILEMFYLDAIAAKNPIVHFSPRLAAHHKAAPLCVFIPKKL